MSPLATQPLVELCLRIESPLKARDGWDRAVARAAFSEELPEIILRRTSKGGGDLWLTAATLHNMPFIREYLLDGLLVKAGILDSAKLERTLASSPTKTPCRPFDIIRHLYQESWLRNWSEDQSLSNSRYDVQSA